MQVLGVLCVVRSDGIVWCDDFSAFRSCLSFLFLFLCSVSVDSRSSNSEPKSSMGGMPPQTERPPHVSLSCCSP